MGLKNQYRFIDMRFSSLGPTTLQVSSFYTATLTRRRFFKSFLTCQSLCKEQSIPSATLVHFIGPVSRCWRRFWYLGDALRHFSILSAVSNSSTLNFHVFFSPRTCLVTNSTVYSRGISAPPNTKKLANLSTLTAFIKVKDIISTNSTEFSVYRSTAPRHSSQTPRTSNK